MPPLAVQTLVENSIKHVVAPDRQGGEIRVRTSRESGKLRIDVSDSGPGFALESIAAGHGLDNLRSRLAMLYGGQAAMTSGRVDGLSAVSLVLPLEEIVT